MVAIVAWLTGLILGDERLEAIEGRRIVVAVLDEGVTGSSGASFAISGAAGLVGISTILTETGVKLGGVLEVLEVGAMFATSGAAVSAVISTALADAAGT